MELQNEFCIDEVFVEKQQKERNSSFVNYDNRIIKTHVYNT